MFLKAPGFWYERKPINKISRRVLWLLSRIYAFFAERNYRRGYKYKTQAAHVVAIGGITVGGSGKTPVIISICKTLGAANAKAAILSRGFGRNSRKLLKVDKRVHTAGDVGDEPLMLSKYAHVFVADDRVKSAKAAERLGHKLMILDDGLTQRDLQPNVKFVVVDSSQGFGNGELLPLGPNRLSFDMIKNDIDAIVIIKASKHENIDGIKSQLPKNIPLIIGYLKENFLNLSYEDRFFAFCGIGYPKKFFNSLDKKLCVTGRMEFPDHYQYSEDDIVDLLDKARLDGVKLITTEKDLCRIPSRYHSFIKTLPIKIIWEDTAKLVQCLNVRA